MPACPHDSPELIVYFGSLLERSSVQWCPRCGALGSVGYEGKAADAVWRTPDPRLPALARRRARARAQ